MRMDTDCGVKSKMVGQAGKDGAMLGRIDRCGCPRRVHTDTFAHGGGMSEAMASVDIAECAPVEQQDGRVVSHADIAGAAAGCISAAAAHVDSLTPTISARSGEEVARIAARGTITAVCSDRRRRTPSSARRTRRPSDDYLLRSSTA
jgi:hypothetical protein